MILGIVGSGAIAAGLVKAVDGRMPVRVLARSQRSLRRMADRHHGDDVIGGTNSAVLGNADVVVEAVTEDFEIKAEVFAGLDEVLPASAIFASTTSSLSVGELAQASGRPDRFAGLHVFNPVQKMPLVELVAHRDVAPGTLAALDELCARLGKTAVVVPDQPGFVVNQLLFPYLFSAIELLDSTGMAAEDVDACMKLGAGHPMGPLELLDFIGLDVAYAIAHNLDVKVPPRLAELVGAGRLGRKTGHGFYDHRTGERHERHLAYR